MIIYLIISLDFEENGLIVRREQMKWIRNSTDKVYVSICFFFVSVCLSTKFQVASYTKLLNNDYAYKCNKILLLSEDWVLYTCTHSFVTCL